LKARMLLDGGKPKVPPAELRKAIEKSGIEVSEGKADFGVVVGGDGRFSMYGRTEEIPLLFVGVRSKGARGSKAHLAQANYDDLPNVLYRIRKGEYKVDMHRRLAVLKNGKHIGEVFTDVYLQRGSESDCIRYRVRISGKGVDIEEAAIGDGVVVSTRAGSSGYYSYPDRIRKDWMDPAAFATLKDDEVGICHITPTFTERSGESRHPLRYAVPWGSTVELSLFRESDARLYGTTKAKSGVEVVLGDSVTVVPGSKVTKVIVLGTQ
jgi:hypothetical protein